MASERRSTGDRRKAVNAARQKVATDRRVSERRQMELWQDADKPDVLGREPSLLEQNPSFDEWERLADEDFNASKWAKHDPGASMKNQPGMPARPPIERNPNVDYSPMGKFGNMVFGDEFDDRRAEEARLASRASRSNTTGSWASGANDEALAALNKRVKGYGVTGTLADMAAAYTMSEGSPMERGVEAAKAGAVGAGVGAGMQAAINATGRLGQIAGRGFVPLGAAMGAYNIYQAAKEGLGWHDAAQTAKTEKAGSEAKYGTVERATMTRRMKHGQINTNEAADQINKSSDPYGRFSPFRTNSNQAVFAPSEATDTFRKVKNL